MGFDGINGFNGVEWESTEILVGFNGCLMGFTGN